MVGCSIGYESSEIDHRRDRRNSPHSRTKIVIEARLPGTSENHIYGVQHCCYMKKESSKTWRKPSTRSPRGYAMPLLLPRATSAWVGSLPVQVVKSIRARTLRSQARRIWSRQMIKARSITIAGRENDNSSQAMGCSGTARNACGQVGLSRDLSRRWNAGRNRARAPDDCPGSCQNAVIHKRQERLLRSTSMFEFRTGRILVIHRCIPWPGLNCHFPVLRS
jgi:hypothetical protein